MRIASSRLIKSFNDLFCSNFTNTALSIKYKAVRQEAKCYFLPLLGFEALAFDFFA